MNAYEPKAVAFNARALAPDQWVAVAATGDHAIVSDHELVCLRGKPQRLPWAAQARFKARFLLEGNASTPGSQRLRISRQAARAETLSLGPALHIIVPTLQCAHSCRYCQVSRAPAGGDTHSMSTSDLDAACDTIFESASPTLTVEFQGGDPLLRFDLVERAIQRIRRRNGHEGRRLRFVIASTLHQLDHSICRVLKEHEVLLSTSLDGPAWLHNKNRPLPTRDAYERTTGGIELARAELGFDAVSALLTATRESLRAPEEIVDEYVRFGFRDIFLRPLSSYGFAKRNQAHLGYTVEEFNSFYARAFERIVHWNRRGVALREVYASILLNKMLCPFDAGYVDLQSPSGAGLGAVAYNYDGYVYPGDEARMLAQSGNVSLRLGRIGAPLGQLLNSPAQRALVRNSLVDYMPGCRRCAYKPFCGPDPVDAIAEFGTPDAPVLLTEHCRRHLGMFDELFRRLYAADDWTKDLFYRWAQPAGVRESLDA